MNKSVGPEFNSEVGNQKFSSRNLQLLRQHILEMHTAHMNRYTFL